MGRPPAKRNMAGFTLTEIMFVVMILGIASGGMVSMFLCMNRVTSDIAVARNANEAARRALTFITRDIREAETVCPLENGGLLLTKQRAGKAARVSYVLEDGTLRRFEGEASRVVCRNLASLAFVVEAPGAESKGGRHRAVRVATSLSTVENVVSTPTTNTFAVLAIARYATEP